jgi:phage gp36-like protein
MAYAVLADLQRRLGRFFDELYLDSEGDVSEDWASADLEDSAAEIDAAIAARYAVPVSATGSLPLVKAWNLALAEELAWSRGGRDAIPANVKDRAKGMRDQLAQVAKGVYGLPGAAGRAEAEGAAIDATAATPVFTREKMSGW